MEKKERKTNTIYNKLQDRLTKRVSPLFHTEKAVNIFNQLSAGRNRYLKLDRIENTIYDPRWVDEIESCISSIDSIIKNPRKIIQNVSEIVPVELARKTNADSVKHLATHSQFVKEVNEHGDVIPNKILNIRSDDFYRTYENRFIATLIRRLVLFTEKRYQIIINNLQVKETEILMMKNKSTIDGKEVEIETKVKISSDVELSEEQKTFNKTFLKRIEEIRKYLLFFYNSDFMKMLKTEKNVRNPILMTNIIRKNVLYNNCYRLYKFIEKFDNVGVEFKVEDKYEELNEAQQQELNNALMTSFLALRGHETIANEKEKIKRFKPVIEYTVEDEAFVYLDYIGSPLNFYRCDDSHMAYLNSLYNEDVPKHPTKKEKEYYDQEIEENRRIREEKKKLEQLKRLKDKEAERAEKLIQLAILKRKKEELLERERLRKEAEQRKLDDIEQARLALVGNPNEFKPEISNIGNTENVPIGEFSFDLPEEPKKEEPIAEPSIAAPIEETPKEEDKVEEAAIKETTEQMPGSDNNIPNDIVSSDDKEDLSTISHNEESQEEENEDVLSEKESLDSIEEVIKEIEKALKEERKEQISEALKRREENNDMSLPNIDELDLGDDNHIQDDLDTIEEITRQIESALKQDDEELPPISIDDGIISDDIDIDDLIDDNFDDLSDDTDDIK